MYKDSKRTCTAIVLLIKPFVWRRPRCRRRRGLLKLPNYYTEEDRLCYEKALRVACGAKI